MAGTDKSPDKNSPGVANPARSCFTITPGAGKLDVIPRALYVGVAGDITVRLVDDADDSTPVVFVAVPQGTILPIRPKYVTAGPASLIGIA